MTRSMLWLAAAVVFLFAAIAADDRGLRQFAVGCACIAAAAAGFTIATGLLR